MWWGIEARALWINTERSFGVEMCDNTNKVYVSVSTKTRFGMCPDVVSFIYRACKKNATSRAEVGGSKHV